MTFRVLRGVHGSGNRSHCKNPHTRGSNRRYANAGVHNKNHIGGSDHTPLRRCQRVMEAPLQVERRKILSQVVTLEDEDISMPESAGEPAENRKQTTHYSSRSKDSLLPPASSIACDWHVAGVACICTQESHALLSNLHASSQLHLSSGGQSPTSAGTLIYCCCMHLIPTMVSHINRIARPSNALLVGAWPNGWSTRQQMLAQLWRSYGAHLVWADIIRPSLTKLTFKLKSSTNLLRRLHQR